MTIIFIFDILDMCPSSYNVFCTLLIIETPGTECYMKRGIFTPFLCIIIPFIKIPFPMGLQGIRLIPERVQVQSWAGTRGCWGIK